jgi:hypothetical protein
MPLKSNLPVGDAPKKDAPKTEKAQASQPSQESLKLKEVLPYSASGRGGILGGAGSNFNSKTVKTFDGIISV